LRGSKRDGYRLQVIKEGHRIRLYSRNGNEWTGRLPDLVDALTGIPCRSAIIDAELVRPGAGGVLDFYRMPAAMRRGHAGELMVYAFDLLHQDGKDLRALPLLKRRRRLERLLDQVPRALPAPGGGLRRRRAAARGGPAAPP
jgi:bifunctional non-homologous end joining protein LigD